MPVPLPKVKLPSSRLTPGPAGQLRQRVNSMVWGDPWDGQLKPSPVNVTYQPYTSYSVQISQDETGGASEIGGQEKRDLEASKTNGNLNLTVEEYLKAVEEGLWENARILSGGVSNNDDVETAGAQTNMRNSNEDKDVIADDAHIRFVRAIYRATAEANNPDGIRGEKIITLGLNDKGDIVVKDIAILSGQGGDVAKFIRYSNATAFIHVHYAGLETKPGSSDHSVPKFAGISNFTITYKLNARRQWRCCNIYEVGRVNNKYVYRDVKRNTPGPWIADPRWR